MFAREYHLAIMRRKEKDSKWTEAMSKERTGSTRPKLDAPRE
jgi:hypothetical protein